MNWRGLGRWCLIIVVSPMLLLIVPLFLVIDAVMGEEKR